MKLNNSCNISKASNKKNIIDSFKNNKLYTLIFLLNLSISNIVNADEKISTDNKKCDKNFSVINIKYEKDVNKIIKNLSDGIKNKYCKYNHLESKHFFNSLKNVYNYLVANIDLNYQDKKSLIESFKNTHESKSLGEFINNLLGLYLNIENIKKLLLSENYYLDNKEDLLPYINSYLHVIKIYLSKNIFELAVISLNKDKNKNNINMIYDLVLNYEKLGDLESLQNFLNQVGISYDEYFQNKQVYEKLLNILTKSLNKILLMGINNPELNNTDAKFNNQKLPLSQGYFSNSLLGNENKKTNLKQKKEKIASLNKRLKYLKTTIKVAKKQNPKKNLKNQNQKSHEKPELQNSIVNENLPIITGFNDSISFKNGNKISNEEFVNYNFSGSEASIRYPEYFCFNFNKGQPVNCKNGNILYDYKPNQYYFDAKLNLRITGKKNLLRIPTGYIPSNVNGVNGDYELKIDNLGFFYIITNNEQHNNQVEITLIIRELGIEAWYIGGNSGDVDEYGNVFGTGHSWAGIKTSNGKFLNIDFTPTKIDPNTNTDTWIQNAPHTNDVNKIFEKQKKELEKELFTLMIEYEKSTKQEIMYLSDYKKFIEAILNNKNMIIKLLKSYNDLNNTEQFSIKEKITNYIKSFEVFLLQNKSGFYRYIAIIAFNEIVYEINKYISHPELNDKLYEIFKQASTIKIKDSISYREDIIKTINGDRYAIYNNTLYKIGDDGFTLEHLLELPLNREKNYFDIISNNHGDYMFKIKNNENFTVYVNGEIWQENMLFPTMQFIGKTPIAYEYQGIIYIGDKGYNYEERIEFDDYVNYIALVINGEKNLVIADKNNNAKFISNFDRYEFLHDESVVLYKINNNQITYHYLNQYGEEIDSLTTNYKKQWKSNGNIDFPIIPLIYQYSEDMNNETVFIGFNTSVHTSGVIIKNNKITQLSPQDYRKTFMNMETKTTRGSTQHDNENKIENKNGIIINTIENTLTFPNNRSIEIPNIGDYNIHYSTPKTVVLSINDINYDTKKVIIINNILEVYNVNSLKKYDFNSKKMMVFDDKNILTTIIGDYMEQKYLSGEILDLKVGKNYTAYIHKLPDNSSEIIINNKLVYKLDYELEDKKFIFHVSDNGKNFVLTVDNKFTIFNGLVFSPRMIGESDNFDNNSDLRVLNNFSKNFSNKHIIKTLPENKHQKKINELKYQLILSQENFYLEFSNIILNSEGLSELEKKFIVNNYLSISDSLLERGDMTKKEIEELVSDYQKNNKNNEIEFFKTLLEIYNKLKIDSKGSINKKIEEYIDSESVINISKDLRNIDDVLRFLLKSISFLSTDQKNRNYYEYKKILAFIKQNPQLENKLRYFIYKSIFPENSEVAMLNSLYIKILKDLK